MITARLNPAIEKKLSEVSETTGRTKTYFINEALKRYLEDMSDLFEAEKAIKKFYSGDKKTYSLKEVRKELGL